MKGKKILVFVLISAIFLNEVPVSAAASIITTFDIVNDFDTGYDFETTPSSFKAKENISETLGTVHQLSWENPKDLPEDFKIEIYAAVEFEIYAPSNFRVVPYTTWAEIENSASRDWIVVDSPYTKVYECESSETSCDIDFNKLLKTIEDYCTDSTANTDDIINFNLITVLGDWATSKLGGESLSSEICIYDYAVNNMKTKEFKFNKIKYFIRYKQVIAPDDPLQEDGLYHYYYEAFEPCGVSVNAPNNIFSKLQELKDVTVKYEYTGGEEVITDGNDYKNFHVKYEIILPRPICFILGGKMSNSGGSYQYYDTSGSVRYSSVYTKIKGLFVNNTTIYDIGGMNLHSTHNIQTTSDGKKVISTAYDQNYTYSELDSLNLLNSNAAYKTNIPVFSPVFSSAAEKYLLTGGLDKEDAGNSYALPGGGYRYGQLLQNTVGFVDGGTSLDKNNQTEKIDGVSDTNNGWLKKIYYFLKDNLINKDGDSWLEKIHTRLEWTNTYLKALIAENTLADIAGFVTGFIGDKFEAVVNTVMDTVNVTVVVTAGETITTAAKTKFPFSVYTNYVTIVNTFAAEPVTPVETVNMKFIEKPDGTYLVDTDLTFDFGRFDEIAKTTRSFCYVLFVIGLIPATRKYVQMIDGGK